MEGDEKDSKKRKSTEGDIAIQKAKLIKKSKSENENLLGQESSPGQPCVLLLFSGKRKSGKDYVTDILQERWVCYVTEEVTLGLLWPGL